MLNLKLGDSTVTEVFHNTYPAKAVYCGSALVWSPPVARQGYSSSITVSFAELTSPGFEITLGDKVFSEFLFSRLGAGDLVNSFFTISIDPEKGDHIFSGASLAYTGTGFNYQYKVSLLPSAPIGQAFYRYNTSFNDYSTNNTGKYKKVLRAYKANGTTQITGGTLGSNPAPANAAVTADTALVPVGPDIFKAVTSDGPYNFAAAETGPIVFKATFTRPASGGRIDVTTDSVTQLIYVPPGPVTVSFAELTSPGFECSIGDKTFSEFLFFGLGAGDLVNSSFTFDVDQNRFDHLFIGTGFDYSGTGFLYQYKVRLNNNAAPNQNFKAYNTGYTGSSITNPSYKFEKTLRAYKADGVTLIGTVTAENAVAVLPPPIGLINTVVSDGPYAFAPGETGPVVFKCRFRRRSSGGRIDTNIDSINQLINPSPTTNTTLYLTS
jgi:hypothetical protein